jgi:hypothetical protein
MINGAAVDQYCAISSGYEWDTGLGGGGTCSQDTCCVALAQCTADFECDANYFLKTTFEDVSYCEGTVCTNDECCEVPVCPADVPVGFIARADVSCAGVACTREECFEQLGTCSKEVCATAGNILKFSSDALPDYCAAVTCREDECCESAEQCTSDTAASLCSGTAFMINGAAVDQYCANPSAVPNAPPGYKWDAGLGGGGTRSQDTCCIALAQCTADFECDPHYALRMTFDDVRYCADTTCMNEECCNLRGQCSDDAPVGFIAKDDAPSATTGTYCAGIACTREECFEQLGTCSKEVCATAGNILKFRSVALPDYCAAVTCRED